MKYSTTRFIIATILLTLLIAYRANSQPKVTREQIDAVYKNAVQVDTGKANLPDTTGKVRLVTPAEDEPFITQKDLLNFYKELRKSVSVDQYESLKPEDILNELVRWSIVEWNKRRKPK